MGFFASFVTSKYVTKIDENKICPGIRRPPDDKQHTTMNRKNAGETEEGWGMMSDMEGTHGESK